MKIPPDATRVSKLDTVEYLLSEMLIVCHALRKTCKEADERDEQESAIQFAKKSPYTPRRPPLR